ncbi:sensor histidine kinase [Sulfurospirillum sp. 1307]
MKYKQINKLFSVKAKTITLVLALYLILSIIFFFVRYLDIKDFAKSAQDSEFKKVKLVYNETLKKVKKFYIARGYANINSFGIKDGFKNKDAKSLYELSRPRWEIITKENKYLKSFSFYDDRGNLLTYFGKKPEKKLQYFKTSKKSYDGFWLNKNSFDYHAIAEARDDKSNIIGYLVFTINPKYFLSEIRKLMDIYAYIIPENNKKILFMLKKDDSITDLVKNQNIISHKEVKIKDGIFLPYIIKGIGINEQNNFKIVFLQDIMHWKATIKKAILQSLIALLILALVTTIIINYGFDIILKELDESNEKLKLSQKKLENLNKNLKIEVEEQIKLKLKKEREANEKERILAHQSKLASMGEMIGNIAHQWRQPLTELSSILINLQLYFERNKLTKEKFEIKAKEANKQIVFMSKTIDDFRNFFSTGKQKEKYKISVIINRVDNLVEASLKNNDIKLDIEIKDDFEIFGFPNEIAQAFLNIVSNAKDVLIEKKIEDAKIEIKTFIQNGKHITTISDNAGGIKVFPIDKVFEPYFSTKHAKSGTGIGLYMTKTIIEKNNNGKIEVVNSDIGAIFTVTF